MPPPAVFSARLTPGDVEVLRLLLGCPLWQIVCPSLRVEGVVSTAWNLSIQLDRARYVIVTSEGHETPVDYLDYFQLHLEVADSPRDIEVNERGSFVDPSQILLRPPSPISKISILERQEGEESDAECVIYDCGLVLERLDGIRVCITCVPMIGGGLAVSTDPVMVTRVVAECRIRIVLAEAS